MTVWVMTRDSTRKVEQIRHHPQVTLYFNDDTKMSYLTIMGIARVHTDPEDTKVNHSWHLKVTKSSSGHSSPRDLS
jgi:general stress protein 26